jgi:hypothetical protein
MRYFTLTYYKQPDGKINEVSDLRQKLRTRDRTDCNVILDFRDEKVIKCTVDGQGLVPDWLTVIEYFSKYYGEQFAQLVRHNAD